jgi:hypothetical protein
VYDGQLECIIINISISVQYDALTAIIEQNWEEKEEDEETTRSLLRVAWNCYLRACV